MLPAVYHGYDHHLFTPQTESNKNLLMWHQQHTSGPSLCPSAGYPRNRKNHALVILALAVHPGPHYGRHWFTLKRKAPRICHRRSSGLPWNRKQHEFVFVAPHYGRQRFTIKQKATRICHRRTSCLPRNKMQQDL